MWHLYHVICKGDRVRAVTVRRIVKTTATGSTSSDRIRMTLEIAVTKIEFDADALTLRIAGRNRTENPHVKQGAHHTIDLEMQRDLSITKDHWDSVALQRVKEATDPAASAEMAAIVMNEGLAFVTLVKSSMTITRAKVEVNVPRKRRSSSTDHNKGLARFYDALIAALLRVIRFDIVKVVLIASPGFIREEFHKYMMAEAVRRDDKVLLDNRHKFVLVRSSSGFRHSIREVLADPGVAAKLADTKAAGEVVALDRFLELLRNDPDRAFYGAKHVEYAISKGAVEALLITDELFRSASVEARKRYVRLVDEARAGGAAVHIFSSMHVSGEELQQLTGIAAILRFPMPEIEEELASDDNGESSDDSETSVESSISDNEDLLVASTPAAAKKAPTAKAKPKKKAVPKAFQDDGYDDDEYSRYDDMY